MPGDILIADDDGVSQQVIKEALAPLGVPVRGVMDVYSLRQALREGEPACLVLDLGFSDGNGLMVLAELQAEHREFPYPIIVLPASSDAEIDEALRAGADDYVGKPFRPLEILTHVRRMLKAANQRKRLSRREAHLKTVAALVQRLASTDNVREALAAIVSEVVPMTSADRVSIVLARTDATAYVVSSSDNPALSDLPIAISDYPEIQSCLDSHRTVTIDDVTTSNLFAVEQSAALPFASMALVPIKDNDVVLGVLYVRGRVAQQIELEQLGLLETLANSAGIAIRRVQLLQDMKSERRQSVEAVKQAELRLKVFQPYADFFQNAADGMVVMEPSGNILYANPVARRLAGLSRKLEGTNVTRFLPPEEKERAHQIAQGFRQGEYPRGVDFTVPSRGGERMILNINFSATLRGAGAVLFTFRDVTRERATENELKRARLFLERVIDSSVDAIVSADIEGTVVIFNRAAARIFGYEQSQVVRRMNVEALYAPGVAREVMRKIRSPQFSERGRLHDYQVDMRDSQGRLIPVRISAALIYDGDSAIGSVGVFTDIRNELRMRAKLKHAQHEIQTHEKSVAVAQLAGATAHELNQPLTSVIAYAEMLARKLEDDEALQRAAHVIVDQAERMANIVRQIGRITRFETKSYVGSAQILDIEKSSRTPDKP
jgi:PAS domain S-box-containing protein